MFGVIVAGRLVQTDFTTLDATHEALLLVDADSINHLCVFMTGLQALPADVAAAVYISFPTTSSDQSPADWHYLGYVTNEKPSAIFRIARLRHSPSMYTFTGAQLLAPAVVQQSQAQLGIALEPLADVIARINTSTDASESTTVRVCTVVIQQVCRTGKCRSWRR